MTRCSATAKATGERCGRWAIRGGSVCPKHGGSAAQVRAKAAETVRLAAAREVAARYGVPVPIGPAQALLAELARSNGLIAFYQAKIDELDSERALVFGVSKIEDKRAGLGRAGRDTTYAAQINLWVTLRDAERDRLARLSVDCAKINLEAQRVRIDQLIGQQVADVIEKLLADLGRSDPEAREFAARRLREIET